MAELADASAFGIETIKLKLFQEVETYGLNPSQTVNHNLSLLRVRIPPPQLHKFSYWGVAQW